MTKAQTRSWSRKEVCMLEGPDVLPASRRHRQSPTNLDGQHVHATSALDAGFSGIGPASALKCSAATAKSQATALPSVPLLRHAFDVGSLGIGRAAAQDWRSQHPSQIMSRRAGCCFDAP